jgi:hopanoid biosynthesis associated protein HpnK
VVITADDFGLAPEVNEAVEIACRDGILTAASLMVSGPAAADAVARAQRLGRLRVGLHLVLTDGRPVLPPQRLPDLVDTCGRFRRAMAALGCAIAARPSVRRQVAAEIEAQFAAFWATGLRLDHVNAHKHFHLHPVIARATIAIGARYGLAGLRVPTEPRSVLAAVEPQARTSSAWMTAPWARLLARTARRSGLQAPDAVFGLAWSGAMTAARLAGLLHHLPPGRTEIYLHPATRDDFTGHAPGYCYRDELAALTAPSTIAVARREGLELGGYADFAGQAERRR